MLIRIHLRSLCGLRITSFDRVSVGHATERVGNIVFQRTEPSQRRELYVHACAGDMADAARAIQLALDPERDTCGWIAQDGAPPPRLA